MMSQTGFAERGLALTRRWREAHDDHEDLVLIEALLTMVVDPPLAARRLRRLADEPRAAGLAVINHVRRAHLEPALELAMKCDWFLENPNSADALSYATWALILDERFE